MIDIRGALARSTKVPQVNRRVTNFLTLHWNGPGFTAADLDQIKGDARYHVNTRGWEGLAYHYAIGRDGAVYQCRDYAARLNHSGVPQGNAESLSVLVLTGEGMQIPPAQYLGLEQFLKAQWDRPRYTLGHQEWPRLTACPGPLLNRWFTAYRSRYKSTGKATTLGVANVRDEPSVLSQRVRQAAAGATVAGTWILGKPYKGDSLWFNIAGTSDYIHGSVLSGELPTWAK